MPTPTSSKNWRKRVGGNELSLPSGNVCLVKRPGMESLMSAGIMPDSLTPIAMQAISKAEAGGRPMTDAEDSAMEQEIMERVMNNPDEMAAMFRSFDKAAAMCVVQPKVALHFVETKNDDGKTVVEDIPEDQRYSDEVPEELEDGTANPFYDPDPPLYTDEIDSDDKQHIFQYVFGDLPAAASFRGAAADVARAQSGEDVQVPPV